MPKPTLMLSKEQLLKLAKKYVDENDAEGFSKTFIFMTPQMLEMMLENTRVEATATGRAEGKQEAIEKAVWMLTPHDFESDDPKFEAFAVKLKEKYIKKIQALSTSLPDQEGREGGTHR